MKDNVVIEGLARLNAKLRDVESGIQRDFEREVTIPTGFDIERIAKRNAPKKTGALAADIHFDQRRSEVRSGDTIDYAVPVHNGHRTRSGSTVAGQPYLKLAANEVQPDYSRRLTKFAAKIERDAAE